jgi:hypothetical protein
MKFKFNYNDIVKLNSILSKIFDLSKTKLEKLKIIFEKYTDAESND